MPPAKTHRALDPTEPIDCPLRQTAVAAGGWVIGTGPARPVPVAPQGSRRRRLWELDSHAHGPVIGVCLPIAALRALADKALDGQALADDYELHCGVVAESRLRTPLAEAVQRELDRRCAAALRQTAKLESAAALEDWWQQASLGGDLAGALWATLTHARCTPALEHRVLGEVQMLQHQFDVASRVDPRRQQALTEENRVLARELGAAQRRSTQQAQEYRKRLELQQQELMRLRAELTRSAADLAALGGELRSLAAAAPDLKSRRELAAEVEFLRECNRARQRAVRQARQEAARQQRHAQVLAAELAQRCGIDPAAPASERVTAAPIDARAVLCVGGRSGSVPFYRRLVEDTGGRFLHHDGGDEDSTAKLDATLAAADLVICQTGCISHDAYWRVKDHCKRTGKRCVFVETPSGARLRRALLTLVPDATL